MPTEKPPEPKDPLTDLSALTALALVGQLGLTVAVPIVGGVLGGVALKRYLGAGGLVIAACIFFGVAVGLYGAFRILLKEAPWDR